MLLDEANLSEHVDILLPSERWSLLVRQYPAAASDLVRLHLCAAAPRLFPLGWATTNCKVSRWKLQKSTGKSRQHCLVVHGSCTPGQHVPRTWLAFALEYWRGDNGNSGCTDTRCNHWCAACSPDCRLLPLRRIASKRGIAVGVSVDGSNYVSMSAGTSGWTTSSRCSTPSTTARAPSGPARLAFTIRARLTLSAVGLGGR